jgi:hypothetical protein
MMGKMDATMTTKTGGKGILGGANGGRLFCCHTFPLQILSFIRRRLKFVVRLDLRHQK